MKTNSDILLRALVLIKCSILARAETPPPLLCLRKHKVLHCTSSICGNYAAICAEGEKNGVKPVCSSTCWGCWRSFLLLWWLLSVSLCPLSFNFSLSPSLPPSALHLLLRLSPPIWRRPGTHGWARTSLRHQSLLLHGFDLLGVPAWAWSLRAEVVRARGALLPVFCRWSQWRRLYYLQSNTVVQLNSICLLHNHNIPLHSKFETFKIK